MRFSPAHDCEPTQSAVTGGADWDENGHIRQIAISAAVRFLAPAQDR